jgi:hypothetical protein
LLSNVQFYRLDQKTIFVYDHLIYVLLPFIQTSLALAESQGLITIKQAFWGGLAATFLLINTKFLTKFSSDSEEA